MKVRCKCGHALAIEKDKVYQIIVPSKVDVSFANGQVRCQRCGAIYLLKHTEAEATQIELPR